MKKNINTKIALFSAVILCLANIIPLVSAEDTSSETMVSDAYNPGLPAADGVTQVDEEKAALLNSIYEQLLNSSVYAEYEGSSGNDHSLSVNLLLEYAYVIYASSDQNELAAAQEFCIQNGIEECNVWFKYTGEIVNTDVFADFPAQEGELITDHAVIFEMLNGFIKENNISSAHFFDSGEKGIVCVIYKWNADREQNQMIKDFIIENKISRNSLEFFMEENSIEIPDISDVQTDAPAETLIYGDLNSDGIADLTDLTLLSLYLMNSAEFNSAQLEAADVQYDGIIDISDLARMKQFVCKENIKLGR